MLAFAPVRFQGAVLLACLQAVFAQGQPVTPHDLEVREQELTSLLQAKLKTYHSQREIGNLRFFLGKGGSHEDAQQVSTTTAEALMVPAPTDGIPVTFWNSARKTLDSAGMSTPLPLAASINAGPKPPKPTAWEAVMQESAQPMDTKLGSAVMYGMSGPVTPTPPPTQATISQEFIAQCPMVLFDKSLSIRAPSCNDTLGRWIDPSPSNVRDVLRWHPSGSGGLFFGVDSKLTGPGTALFAEVTEQLTLTGYSFVMKNCLGVERWQLEENVYKVDSMGRVSSTLELHDITLNSEAFFLKYIIRSAAGVIAAESNLFRMGANQVNFTEWKDERNTGRLLAIATRQGQWSKKGWRACMSPKSPRGWSLSFPQENKHLVSAATVQDIRVAITGTVTLMAYRDENRGTDGLDTQGESRELIIFIGGVVLVFVLCILLANFCVVFRASGLKEKFKRILFDSEGSLLPKRPHQQRSAPLYSTC